MLCRCCGKEIKTGYALCEDCFKGKKMKKNEEKTLGDLNYKYDGRYAPNRHIFTKTTYFTKGGDVEENEVTLHFLNAGGRWHIEKTDEDGFHLMIAEEEMRAAVKFLEALGDGEVSCDNV